MSVPTGGAVGDSEVGGGEFRPGQRSAAGRQLSLAERRALGESQRESARPSDSPSNNCALDGELVLALYSPRRLANGARCAAPRGEAGKDRGVWLAAADALHTAVSAARDPDVGTGIKVRATTISLK